MSSVAGIDFTLSKEACGLSHTQIIEKLYPEYVKRYCFQLEEGDEGYLHYQGRVSLIKKRMINQARILLQTAIPEISIRPTCNASIDNSFYVIKADTRVEGPWQDTDEKPQYIPRQVREIESLLPWQEKIVEMSKIWDTRKIHIIYDTTGCIGKSTLVTYMGVYGLAKRIPFANDYQGVLRMVYDLPTSRAYLIDMPRAINKEKLYQMYSAIETVKDGYAYDDRNHFKDKYFDCPNIFVFTNSIPESSMLSVDRWAYWEVIDNQLNKSVRHLAV